MRYFLRSESAVVSFYRVNADLLVVRSLDVVLENKIERLQALRLVRKLLGLNPGLFSPALTRCLVSLARDGLAERDILTRSCCATLSELTILAPEVSAQGSGVSAILDCILQSTHSPQITEALISCILHLLNDPSLRSLVRGEADLQQLIGLFTDCYSSPDGLKSNQETFPDANDHREAKFVAARKALISILRSWPGLIYLSHYNTNESPNGIQSIIETLHMPYSEIRRHILDFLFDLFNIPQPQASCDNFEAAHKYLEQPERSQDSCLLYDGFIAVEGRNSLPHTSKSRVNLYDNYMSILLYSLISYGLVEALTAIIIRPKNRSNSVRATILLGQVLFMSSRLLPPEVAQKCHALPILVKAASCGEDQSEAGDREAASAAISFLDRMHSVQKSDLSSCSLYLEHLLKCSGSYGRTQAVGFKSTVQLKSSLTDTEDVIFNGYIRDSNVLNLDHQSWDWDMVSTILCYPTDSFKRLEDELYKRFIKRLIKFLRPKSGEYSAIDSGDVKGRQITVACCHLLAFLEELEESKGFEYLQDFLLDLSQCFSQIIKENASQSATLSPTRLISTLSQYYFLFIGTMSDSSKGKKLLEKIGLYQQLLDLLSIAAHEIYLKLIVSSLDYAKESSFSRTLLTKSLTSPSEASRIYTTNYMRVILRANSSDFRWAIEMLIPQVFDESRIVSAAAFSVLDEACDHQTNLETLIRSRPSLAHSHESGTLLMSRFFSTPTGFKMMQEKNLVDHTMQEWKSRFHLKYVRIVEALLNETLTYHFMSDDGTYGRRSDKRTGDRNSYLPPHLYGQLVKHEEGLICLQNFSIINSLLLLIRKAETTSDFNRLELKAALWSIGHICSTPLGLSLVSETSVIEDVVSITANCPFLSLRGTAFYCLGLISSTDAGSDKLHLYGWESIRHTRSERWPFVQVTDDTFQKMLQHIKDIKAKSDSVSTSGLTDIMEQPSEKTLTEPKGLASPPLAVYGSLPPDCALASSGITGIVRDVLKSGEGALERPRSSSEILSSGKLATQDSISELVDSMLTIGTSKSDSERTDSDVFYSDHFDSKRKLPFPKRDKSRSGSYTNDSSGVGSIASLIKVAPYPGPKSHPKLSPIASINSVGSFIVNASHGSYHNLGRQVSQMTPDTVQDSINSPDVQGYAIFLSIQRQRVLSMGHLTTDNRLMRSSSSSSTESDDHSELDASFSFPSGKFKFVTQPSLLSSCSENEEEPRIYMGVCLPLCLSLMFIQPQQESSKKIAKTLAGRHDSSSGLDFHNHQNCLLCYRVQPVRLPTISFTTEGN